jgi:hypothetical protein
MSRSAAGQSMPPQAACCGNPERALARQMGNFGTGFRFNVRVVLRLFGVSAGRRPVSGSERQEGGSFAILVSSRKHE